MANILMIVPALYCGGGLQKISLQLSQELLQMGHNVVVVDEHEPPLDKLTYLKRLPVFCKLESYDVSRSNLDCFSKVVSDNHINLIIYQGFFQSVNKFLGVWRKKNMIPVISVFHNTPDAPMPKGRSTIPQKGLKNIVKRLAYPAYYKYSVWKVGSFLRKPSQFSERVLLLSKTFVQRYYELAGFRNNIGVMPNFVYQNSLTSVERKKQLLYVGRLEEEAKHFSRVLRLWERLYSRYPDWSLIVAGQGKEKARYEKYVKEKGLKNVSFLGHVSNPDNLYHSSSISLITSDYEGFPLVIIEAMVQGCVPVAYQSFSSVTDIIDIGINGELIKPFDEEEYLRRVEFLMNNETYRISLSKNAVKKAFIFSPKRIIPQWNKLIKETISQRMEH